MPTLSQTDKCDFNDVLKEKGIDAVKEQLSQSRPIHTYQHAKQEVIPLQEIYERLHETVDEWERLKLIKSPSIDRILLAKSKLDQATKSLSIEIQTRGYENAIKSLYKQKKLFSKVKAVAPNLAKSFEEISQPVKEVKIDWLSYKYNAEFDNLRQSKEKSIQYLVKFRDNLEKVKDTPKERMMINRLETAALNILRSKCKADNLKQLAPKLAEKLMVFVKFKSKQKDIGRDL